MKKAVIYGPIQFPDGDAGSNQVKGRAVLLANAGYEVLIIGVNPNISSEKLYQLEEYENIYYTTIGKKRFKRFNDAVRYFNGGISFIKCIKKFGYENPEILLTYGGYFFGNYIIAPFYKRKSKLIVDICEWYSPHQLKSIGIRQYINNQIGVRFFYKLYKNKIVVSKYLGNYYGNAFVLPPIVDANHFIVEEYVNKDKVEIIYAGKNQGKDELSTFFEAFQYLEPDEKERFDVQIFGVNKQMLLQQLDKDIKKQVIKDNIVTFNSRLKRKELLRKIAAANFIIIFRPVMRYSMAGFPSKVPEGLSCGTPVLCNYTSDLETYLTDSVNCIVCSSMDAKDIAKGLKRISKMSKEELNLLKRNARITAIEKLSLSAWQKAFQQYILSLK